MFKILLRTVDAYLRTMLGRYVRPRRYKQIFDEIDRVRPRNIMEVGTWNGSRAVEMIEEASRYQPIESIHYFGYDLFEDLTKELYQYEVSKMPPTQKDVEQKLEKTGAQVSLYRGYTQETMKNTGSLPKMDFVFIDGGHAEDTVRSDWQAVEKTMDKSSVVIFDDYWHNRPDGPKKVIDAIDRAKYNVEILPETDVFFNKDFGRLAISLAKVTLR